MARRKRNKFAGVDDIYLTKKSIAVRHISSWFDRQGRYKMSDKTKYYKKTAKNLKQAYDIHGRIRYGRS